MCKFFSADSDGKGNIFFFAVEEVAKIMAEGNPKGYEFNSHTSIADKCGFKGEKEDKLNKWEYDPDKGELTVDSLVVNDDREKVLKKIKEYFEGKNIPYLKNLYNLNSGNRNSGNRNSGDLNSGNRNSGNWNSGNWNSGDWNSGNRNSGDWNSGDLNSGNRNSGNRNSGDRNSGNLNSGDLNSELPMGSFCSKRKYYLFDKPVTEIEYRKFINLDYSWFILTEWINEDCMSNEEKQSHPSYAIAGGYLKKYGYKEAWIKCPPEVLKQIMALPKFDAKVFEEISGIKVKKASKK